MRFRFGRVAIREAPLSLVERGGSSCAVVRDLRGSQTIQTVGTLFVGPDALGRPELT